MRYMYITNKPDVATIAQKYSTDMIFVDLETIGKGERQKEQNSVKSNHTINDVHRLRNVLNSSELLVRVNPINHNSKDEIDAVVCNGADIIMLPMWKTVDEVKLFLDYVDGRAKTMLLLENKEARECLDMILILSGIDYIHIGLNDMHLSYKMTFMFELLANGIVEELCMKIAKKGIPYGFGGIARLGEGLLPAEKIILEHYRLGSSMAILSRSFCNVDLCTNIEEVESIFKNNIYKIRDFEYMANEATELELKKNQLEVKEKVAFIVKQMNLK